MRIYKYLLFGSVSSSDKFGEAFRSDIFVDCEGSSTESENLHGHAEEEAREDRSSLRNILGSGQACKDSLKTLISLDGLFLDSMPRSDLWNYLGGPSLLSGESPVSDLACLMAVVDLIAPSADEARFAEEIGLDVYCHERQITIQNFLEEDHRFFQEARKKYFNVEFAMRKQIGLEVAYAARFDKLCPSVFSKSRLVSIPILHRLFRVRMLKESTGPKNLRPARARVFDLFKSLSSPNPPEYLMYGLGKIYWTDEEMVASERDWFLAMADRIFTEGSGLLFTECRDDVEVAYAIGKFLAVAFIHEITLGIDLPTSFFDDLVNHQGDENTRVIVDGFQAVLSREILGEKVTGHNLQEIFQGIAQIDVDSLKTYSTYVYPLEEGDEQVEWLWSIISSFDNDMKRKFIKFLTGVSAMPVGGFGTYKEPINIHESMYEQFRTMPYELRFDIPKSPTAEVLREQLIKALGA